MFRLHHFANRVFGFLVATDSPITNPIVNAADNKHSIARIWNKVILIQFNNYHHNHHHYS
jgi:hypothetical protein